MVKDLFIRYAKSLRVRLFLILLFVGIIPIFVLKNGILRNYETQAVEQRISLIQSRSEMIAEELGNSGYLTGNPTEALETQIRQLCSIWNGRAVIVNEKFRVLRDTFESDEGKVLIAKKVLESFKGSTQTNYNSKQRYLEVTVPVKEPGSDVVRGLMIITAPTTDIEDGRTALSGKVFIIQIVMMVLVLAVAFYAAGLLVRPFGKITAFLNEKDQFLDEDISIPEYTETRLLAEAYNRMRRTLRAQEDSRQEFVSNVSHELKTPLTSMKVLADSLNAQEDVPVELYREFMQDIAAEIDRENTIITDLLELVKMDRKSTIINIKETNINDLIDLILKRLIPIAAVAGVELVPELGKTVVAQVDETKLTLAVTNLVENAIKYNREGGWVHVSLNSDANYFFIKVEDNGMGIPEEDQEYIFERFYRVDKSHSREIGGTGLGLAITRSAVLMHHGAVRVYSKEGEGTTFTIRIPLIYERDPEDTGEDLIAEIEI